MRSKRLSAIAFCAGLLLLSLYVYSIRPPEFSRGYAGDFCTDTGRQAIAENWKRTGGLDFSTPQFAAPEGIATAYFPWGLERDGLGALVWNWDKDFPFAWAWLCFSLLAAYIFCGWVLKKFSVPRGSEWLLSAIFVLFHVPRHLYLWRDPTFYSHLHWVYLSFFLDAWIWKKIREDGIWRLDLELWRWACLAGGMGLLGHYWGPLLLEFAVLRAFFIFSGAAFAVNRRSLAAAAAAFVFFAVIDAYWFSRLLPLIDDFRAVHQPVAWAVGLRDIFSPLYWDFSQNTMRANIGWSYWLPLAAGIFLSLRRGGRKALLALAPFLILLLSALLYMQARRFGFFVEFLQTVVPTMAFFRNASRWALLLPPICGALLLTCMPELLRALRELSARRKKILVAVFVLGLWLESRWLAEPAEAMPPLAEEARAIFSEIRALPGDTVLDLPFCMIGANDVCGEQCPYGFDSNIGQCFRAWHEKKVFGLYAGRLEQKDCRIYDRKPYQSWFAAWKEERCFDEKEWDEFCAFLDTRSELSAVLVYPDLWSATGKPECSAEFTRRLGKPLREAQFFRPRAGQDFGFGDARLRWYAPHCAGSAKAAALGR